MTAPLDNDSGWQNLEIWRKVPPGLPSSSRILLYPEVLFVAGRYIALGVAPGLVWGVRAVTTVIYQAPHLLRLI